MAPAAEQSIDDSFDFGDVVDRSIFDQILEMDGEEDDGHEFSQSIVFDFFSQAEATFVEMDSSLEDEDLQSLSDKGHFLKGSSATLGFTKIKDECEKIQNWGKKKDETGINDETDEKKLLKLISVAITDAKKACQEAETVMKNFYNESGQ